MNYNNNYFCSNIYDYELKMVGKINIQQFSDPNSDNGLFFKSCYLYEKYLAFIYFIDPNNLALEILGLILDDNDFEKILHYTDSNSLSGKEITLNEFLKIDNNRLVFMVQEGKKCPRFRKSGQ